MKSGESTTRTIDQIRVTLGIMRETIFLQTRIEFRLESPEIIFSGELLEVEENSRRDEKESRTLVFLVRTSSEQNEITSEIKESQNISFRFGIDNFLVHGQVKITKCLSTKAGVTLYTEVPTSIEITNARKSRRKSKEAPICLATVLVRSGGLHTEGQFELYDYSRGGYGGLLKVPHGFSLVNDTQVKGRLELGANAIPLSCKLKRAQLINEKAEDWDSYQVGMEDSPENKEKSPADQNTSREKRTSTRTTVQEHIELTSAINPDVSFRLLVDEASVTGFSGTLANTANLIEFPIGSSFQMESPPLSVVLQGFDGERLRFAIHAGGINERLEWFKRISPYLLDGISHSVFDARDLLQVFCSSGALSSEYLKTQNTHRSELLGKSEKTRNEQFWVHRWIHHNQDKSVTGHFCALRLGENSWIFSDLAGSPTTEAKLPPNFVGLFLASFSEFSLSTSPAPIHLHTWVAGHPYWEKFRTDLLRSGLVLEQAVAGYTRYSGSNKSSSQTGSEIEHSQIQPSNYNKIQEIQDALRPRGTLFHSSLFDFEINRFSSPTLKTEFRKQNQNFLRSYFEITSKQTTWLSVFSIYPMGESFNRLPEAVWLFQLRGNQKEANDEWSDVLKGVFQISLRLGIKPSSIRRVSSHQSRELLEGEIALMDSFVTHPAATKLHIRL